MSGNGEEGQVQILSHEEIMELIGGLTKVTEVRQVLVHIVNYYDNEIARLYVARDQLYGIVSEHEHNPDGKSVRPI